MSNKVNTFQKMEDIQTEIYNHYFFIIFYFLSINNCLKKLRIIKYQ
jgi:hypothetical protein